MTSDEYATLMDFLATRFARMDAAFAAMERRQDAIEARLSRSEVLWESMRDDLRRVAEGVVAVNERLDRFETETRTRLDAHERRFDGIEARLDGIEARLEEHDRRFDGIEARLDAQARRFDTLDRGLGGIQVQFDRFAVDFGTVQLDHSARIEALERWRSANDAGG